MYHLHIRDLHMLYYIHEIIILYVIVGIFFMCLFWKLLTFNKKEDTNKKDEKVC